MAYTGNRDIRETVSANNPWVRDHIGDYLKSKGYVWRCEDICDCSEPLVVDVYRNQVTQTSPAPSVIRLGIWVGTLHAYRLGLQQSDPGLEAVIEWSYTL